MKDLKKFLILILLLSFTFISRAENIKRKVEYFKDGQKISEKEFIKKGKSGVKVVYEKGIKRCEIKYKNGKENGRCLEWDKNGIKKIETNYLNGSKHGQCLEWHYNGQKNSEGKYLNDKKEGRWLKWDKYGNLIFEEFWKKGRLILIKDLVHYTSKSVIYYPNGHKRYQREFKGTVRNGRWIKWNINGNKVYEREYKDGMKHGKWVEWDVNENITTVEIWDKGKMTKKIK